MPEFLTAEQERLRVELRQALEQLESSASAFGASGEERRLLSDAIRGLQELFLLVVVGEFNAGKSALLNELIGQRLLAEGVTPTTAAVTLVRFGEQETNVWLGESFLERRLPAEPLRDLAVVDTPGTNAIIREHEQLTRDFLPRADMVLFVTSADRPFTETERELLARIREWGKKVVVVINKLDLLETAEAQDQVLRFVREGLQSTLGVTPPIFAVSVKLARAAAEATDPAIVRALAAAGRVAELRAYIFDVLDEEERLRLKLATPLGIAERLLSRYEQRNAEQLSLLADDARLVENVDRQIELYAEDLRRDFAPRLAEIENVIHELNQRGERFFDETVRIGRVFDLLNPERTRGAFEREVVGDTAQRIDQLVGQVVDWLVDGEARLWRQVSAIVRQRQQSLSGPAEEPDFLTARREVLQSVVDRTRGAMRTFDREREAREIGQAMRDAVAQTALAEVGALSLGAAIALLMGTAAADVTGFLAASLAAGLGLYILPARKRRALDAFRKKTGELRERLTQVLQLQVEREVVGSIERVREAIAPYTRHIRAETSRLESQRDTILQLRERLGQLHGEIDPRSAVSSR